MTILQAHQGKGGLLSITELEELNEIAETGAGYFRARIWGCPPAIKVPQDGWIRDLIKTISTVSIYFWSKVY